MAKRGREGALKRAREKARQEKQEAKRERRHSRVAGEGPGLPADEDALLEEYARLSARYEANQLTEVEYDKARHRIFVALGVEPAED